MRLPVYELKRRIRRLAGEPQQPFCMEIRVGGRVVDGYVTEELSAGAPVFRISLHPQAYGVCMPPVVEPMWVTAMVSEPTYGELGWSGGAPGFLTQTTSSSCQWWPSGTALGRIVWTC